MQHEMGLRNAKKKSQNLMGRERLATVRWEDNIKTGIK
jgi:hypothetical protein